MSYRPFTTSWSFPDDWPVITDSMILTRPKVKYYGAYPAGFLHRARQVLGARHHDPVLHVCGGKIREYPYRGLGPNDATLDLDPDCSPDFLQDAREPFPLRPMLYLGDQEWHSVLIDRPYSKEDAEHYAVGPDVLPEPNLLVKNGIAVVPIGGKVGMLDYIWPSPPKNAVEAAVIAVYTGRNARARVFTVFERLS